jgi:hypothetical protein
LVKTNRFGARMACPTLLPGASTLVGFACPETWGELVGWEKDYALFDRGLKKVIRALRTGEADCEKPPPAKP